MLIDSHCHLQDKKFSRDLDRVLERSADAGIQHLVCIGDKIDTSKKAVQLARRLPNMSAVIGVHPSHASSFNMRSMLELKTLMNDPKVVGIGEIGLDYHYPNYDPAAQRECFVTQAHLAFKQDLPLVIHCRDAYDDLLYLIQHDEKIPRRGIVHCYSGDVEQAKAFVEMGYFLGIGGAVSYPNGDRLREVVREVGLERIVCETDAPYLPPQNKRGRRNEPSYMKFTIKQLADLAGVKYQDAARITKSNTIKLFGIPEQLDPTVAYPIRETLYVAVTNQCTCDCYFCQKCMDYLVMGHLLKLDHEPSVDELMQKIEDPTQYREIVISGLGEPTMRWGICKDLAMRLKKKGARVRLNTNGHGNRVNGHDITPEMAALFDSVAINMMGHDEESYLKIAKPFEPEGAWQSMLDFVECCKEHVPDVVMTAVAVPDFDVEVARQLAEDEFGVRFRIREYRPTPGYCATCETPAEVS